MENASLAAIRPALLAACLGLLHCAGVSAQGQALPCGNPLVNGYGPYDYRTDQGPKLKIVEDYHFTAEVESLVRGVSATLAGDIGYTLRAYPNHHRALVAMMNLGNKLKTPTPPGAGYSVECFFVRAVTFRPDDTVARMLFARYLGANGRKADAIKQLEYTAQFAKDNGFTHYNIGLGYLELKEYAPALAHAHQAMALGFDRPLLKQQLQAAGQWRDPEPAAVAAPATATSAPAAATPATAPGSAPG